MRDIKFRGKRIDNGEWVYGYYWTNECDNHFIKVTKDNETGCFVIEDYEVDVETVGQYAELYDSATSNGIYEQDIVKFEYDGEEKIATIKSEQGIYIIINNQLPDGYIWLNDLYEVDGWCNCEVIGNESDNPELLGGGQVE